MPRWLVVGFVSGFLAVLVFHQGALGRREAGGGGDDFRRGPPHAHRLVRRRATQRAAGCGGVCDARHAGRADRQRGLGPWHGARAALVRPAARRERPAGALSLLPLTDIYLLLRRKQYFAAAEQS